MNGLHIHLMVNHFPVVGSVAALGLMALVFRWPSLRRAALAAAVLAGLSAAPAFLSGEPAEEAVESAAVEPLIEAHEEAAEAALVAALLAAALAAGGLTAFRFRGEVPRWVVSVVGVALLVQTALMWNAARLGGQIAHAELRPLSAPSQPG